MESQHGVPLAILILALLLGSAWSPIRGGGSGKSKTQAHQIFATIIGETIFDKGQIMFPSNIFKSRHGLRLYNE
jgi:hypothetical protein